MHSVEPKTTRRVVQFNQSRLQIGSIFDMVTGVTSGLVLTDPVFRAMIARGADSLDRLLREDRTIYGAIIGYGDFCTANERFGAMTLRSRQCRHYAELVLCLYGYALRKALPS